jgi:hypothetical protein
MIDRGETSGSPQRPPKRGPKRDLDLGDLLAKPQVRLWALRVGLAVVIGVLFAIAFDLRIGLTAAVIAVIVDTVRKAKAANPDQYPVSSAERKTAKQLNGLAKQGWRVLHARAIPRDDAGVSDGKIDHLVIGPTGVFAIDSESWDSRLPVRTLSHTRLFHGPFEKKDRLDEARWEANQASRILSLALGEEIPVQPSVAIYGPSVPWRVMSVRNVDVYAGGKAKTYLLKRPKVLTQEEVDRIANAAAKALPSKFEI